ncbi:HlyD family efflux transporter periplasmic adaptor subunit [Velocimicrobium porci]|uniref:RND related barrel-sandwich hybrid domain-containing protein n=1 Tax=Velocimicrobium porci TaxID=2606634 RepID=A0A6L5Y012_9FIRM|nr:HlyD family efflux transporter periplasmic adaptor subunit [Velocimicrobium porci]MSS64385.1 hypothetical protein [Velocimicrobium porci]
MTRRNKKVVKYRKPLHLNVGVVVFLIIFIYIICITGSYFQKDHISIYEVAEKSISDDNTFRGIILRDETIYYAEKAGYVNYYIGEGEKVGKKSTVYSIDESGDIYKQISEQTEETTISTEDTEHIRNSIASFHKNYKNSAYHKVSDFKYEMENAILELNNSNLLTNLSKIKKGKNTKNYFDIVSAQKSGIITYTMDGKEDLKESDITSSLFKESEESRVQLRTNKPITSGSPVYKMINSEKWNIIIPLNEAQYGKLKENETVNIVFKKDDISTTAGFTTFKKEGSYFGKLSLDRYMIRYLNERFLDIEILLTSAEGLKIPTSSILKKKVLLVPLDYLTESNGSRGVVKETYKENGDKEYKFIDAIIYKTDEENNLAYIEASELKSGDKIHNPDSQKNYELSKTGTLEGVYNVNKGYAVFRVIEKIYENKEYVIVSKDTPYGLSNYDHIVLDADTIDELQIIGK